MPSADCIRVRQVSLRREAVSALAETFPSLFHCRHPLADSEKCPLPQKRNPSSTRKSGRSHFFENTTYMPTSPQLREEMLIGMPSATSLPMVSGDRQ